MLAVTRAPKRLQARQTRGKSLTGRSSVAVNVTGMSSPIKLLGISGSLRKASYNTGTLRAAAKVLPSGVELEIVDVGNLPLLNQDLESKDAAGGLVFPEVVEAWRQKVADADAILFACPEYNFGVTPALKNAIDWASRQPNAWDDKAAAIISSGGGVRGVQANRVLRLSGVFLNLHFLNKPEVMFGIGDGIFDRATGDLVNPESIERVRVMLESLAQWTRRLQQ